MNSREIQIVEHEGEFYHRIKPEDVDLSQMDLAQKITDVFAFQIGDGHEQDVVTQSDGIEETVNHAYPGDWIVYNIGNAQGNTLHEKIATADVKVIREEDFDKLYEKSNAGEDGDGSVYSDYDPIFHGPGYNEASIYHYIGRPIYAARVPFNFVIPAPWGEDQFIREGGYLIYNPNTSRPGHYDIYGIQGAHHKKAGQFEKTYTKIGDGNYDAIEQAYKFLISCDRSPVSGIQFNMPDLQRAYDRIGRDIQKEFNV